MKVFTVSDEQPQVAV